MTDGNQDIQRRANKSCSLSHNDNSKLLQIGLKNQSMPDFEAIKFDRISLDILNSSENSKVNLNNQKLD